MNTVIFWLLGSVALLTSIFATLTFRAWRESKRSPYYFLRRQAEQAMQTYSLFTVGLSVVLLFMVSYAWQPPKDTTTRVAFISNAKPLRVVAIDSKEPVSLSEIDLDGEEADDEQEEETQVVKVRGATITEVTANLLAEQNGLTAMATTSLDAELLASGFDRIETLEETSQIPVEDVELTLPPEFDKLTSNVDLRDRTDIGALSFSTEIDEFDLIALSPGRLFDTGFYTIYATFEYDQMADGMVWSWVWRRDGQVISGGNEEWVYGNDGPGYVYLNPIEGFDEGEYTLEIWVNSELLSSANMFITNDIAATR